LLNGEKGAIGCARTPSNMQAADRLEYIREQGIFPEATESTASGV
jgi:hypothetical protein